MALEPDVIVQVLLPARQRLLALAVAVVRDVHAADDLFQQVVVSALEHRAQFRDREHLIAWSVRVIRHRAVDLARGRRLRSLPDEILDLFESRWDDPAGPVWSDKVEALHHCLGDLAAPARTLLQMKHAEGLPSAAIAARLQRTTVAIVQNLCRIHRTLRECVERKLGRLRTASPEGSPR
ncbi:MAG TPA: sigma-70 family RNA polymerase sigma factor [Gemmataceae bacterium]|nr:sigma-70 family RNA polymerase sigma factor [Gemmataceae bacterium]